MFTQISHVQLLVKSYDEAIKFYVEKLGFEIFANDPMPGMGEGVRWVVISPKKDNQTMISLSLATKDSGLSLVGKQGGEYPFLNIFTDNIEAALKSFEENDIEIVVPLGSQPWGKDCMIKDLYGNLLYIVEQAKM